MVVWWLLIITEVTNNSITVNFIMVCPEQSLIPRGTLSHPKISESHP